MTTTLKVPTTFLGHEATGDASMTRVSDLLADADLAYDIAKVPATYNWQDDNGDDQTLSMEGQFGLVRSDTGVCLSEQTVKNSYKPMTPTYIADDFQFFVDGGYASPFSAFRTGNGVECIALLLNPDLFKGLNGFSGFILGQNKQGQKSASGALFVYREICTNGMMGWAKSGSFSIAHRGEVRTKFTNRTREWKKIEQAFIDMDARMTELSGVPMTLPEFTTATDELVGVRTQKDGTILAATGDKEASTRSRNIHANILAATNMPAMGTQGRSAADFYNAVTYHNSHLTAGSKRSVTSQGDSLITGSARTLELASLAIVRRFELASV